MAGARGDDDRIEVLVQELHRLYGDIARGRAAAEAAAAAAAEVRDVLDHVSDDARDWFFQTIVPFLGLAEVRTLVTSYEAELEGAEKEVGENGTTIVNVSIPTDGSIPPCPSCGSITVNLLGKPASCGIKECPLFGKEVPHGRR